MPTASFHSFYWAGSADAPAAPAGAAYSYQRWMVNTTMGGGFGVLQVVWDWAVHASTTTEWGHVGPRQP